MKQDESDRYQIAKPFFFHGTYKENDCSQKMKKKPKQNAESAPDGGTRSQNKHKSGHRAATMSLRITTEARQMVEIKSDPDKNRKVPKKKQPKHGHRCRASTSVW